MKRLFDFLKKKKLYDFDSVVRFVHRSNYSDIIDTIDDIRSIILQCYNKTENDSMFNFVANSSFAGDIFPCETPDCRLGNIDRLSRFAVLYSDYILIPSPFDKYEHIDSFSENILIVDLLILLELKPLLEAGLIGFSTSAIHLCSACMNKLTVAEKSFDDKLSVVNDIIESEYLSEIKFSIFNDEDVSIHVEGPEKYGFHGSMILSFRNYVPYELKDYVLKGKNTKIPPQVVRELGLLNKLTNPVVDDLILQNVWVNLNQLTYLTDRDIDIDVLNALHDGYRLETSKKMAVGFEHLLPIVQNVELNDIIRLRKDDGESFEVYRDAVNSVLKDIDAINPDNFREAFNDVIRPEINNINKKIKINKKGLLKSSVSDLVTSSGLVTFGLYSGVLPQDIGKILSLIGGVKFGTEIITKLRQSFEVSDSVKENKYYFLWKLQNKR